MLNASPFFPVFWQKKCTCWIYSVNSFHVCLCHCSLRVKGTPVLRIVVRGRRKKWRRRMTITYQPLPHQRLLRESSNTLLLFLSYLSWCLSLFYIVHPPRFYFFFLSSLVFLLPSFCTHTWYEYSNSIPPLYIFISLLFSLNLVHPFTLILSSSFVTLSFCTPILSLWMTETLRLFKRKQWKKEKKNGPEFYLVMVGQKESYSLYLHCHTIETFNIIVFLPCQLVSTSRLTH